MLNICYIEYHQIKLLLCFYQVINYLKYLYLGKDVSGTESPTRQLQVFIDSSRPLDAASQALVLELFEEARGRLDPLLWPEAIP